MSQRLAPLLVFNGQYKNDSSLNREGVLNTKQLFDKAFFSPEGLGLSNNTESVLLNEEYSPFCRKIREYVERVDVTKDIPLFYYCGHGFPLPDKKDVAMAMADTTEKSINDDAYNVKKLIELFQRRGISKYIIILDCCHSGYLTTMGEANAEELAYLDYFEGENAVFISSSQKEDEINQTKYNDKYYLPFSYYFANVLLAQDEIVESIVSIKEIFDAVKTKLNQDPNYHTTCRIKNNGDLVDKKIFNIGKKGVDTEETPLDIFGIIPSMELKVLLVKTAIDHPIKYDDFGVPMGLWMLKGYISVTGRNIKVDIYDERLELHKCGKNAKKREEVKNRFKRIIKQYDVVGISLSSSEVFPALKKFKIAKDKGLITFAGGIFTYSNEEYLIKTGLVDYVIPGVSTKPLTDLLAELLKQKKQGKLSEHVIVQKSGIATVQNVEQFDGPWIPSTLPTMRRSLWIEILDTYGKYLNNKMDIYTSRGCDKNCSFCSVQKESRRTIFRKQIDSVIEEINYLKSRGITRFSIKDEDLFTDYDRMIVILKATKGDGIKFKIRARYDEVSNAIRKSKVSLEYLSNLGVEEIQYGIESTDFDALTRIHKGIKNFDTKELANFIIEHSKYNITANCSFILCIEKSTKQYYEELKTFIREIYNDSSKPKIYINFITPHPYNSKINPEDYVVITKNLNYYTHKFPVCYPKNRFGYLVRKAVLETYDYIVEYTNSELYNPPSSKMPEELKKKFLDGIDDCNGDYNIPLIEELEEI